MQKLVCLLAFGVALVHSLPAAPYGVPAAQSPEAAAPITKQESELNYDGSFKNNYETGNGIVHTQSGFIKSDPKSPEPIQAVQGSLAYTAPDGQLIQLQYIADENGFQPQGAHLPTPPPADPQIIKSLEYLASLPSTPEPPQAKFAYQPKYAYGPSPPPPPQKFVYQQPAPQKFVYQQPAPQKFAYPQQY